MLKNFKVATPAIPAHELAAFRSYVKSFYSTLFYDDNANLVCPVLAIADNRTIDAAIDVYIANLGEHMKWGGGDSIDRERVREILQPGFQAIC